MHKIDPYIELAYFYDILEDETYEKYVEMLILAIQERYPNIENATLVWLNAVTIPSDIVKGMKEHIDDELNKEHLPLIFDKKTMIEKSPWSDTSAAPKEFDPFNLFD